MARTALSLPFDKRRLRAARERAGLTQGDLARVCTEQGTPVHRLQVVRAETGKNMPQPHILKAFVQALGVSVDDLLTGPDGAKSECVS